MGQYYIYAELKRGQKVFCKNAPFVEMVKFIRGNHIRDLEVVEDETDPASIKFIITSTTKTGKETTREHLLVKVTDIGKEKPNGKGYEVTDTRIYNRGELIAEGQEVDLIDLLQYAFTNWQTEIDIQQKDDKTAELHLLGLKDGHRVEIELYDLEE